MEVNSKSLNAAEKWVRSEASDNPCSLARRLRESSIVGVAARLESELPNSTAQQKADWLIAFAKSFPMHFASFPYLSSNEMTKLSAAEKLALANGEELPHLLGRKPEKPE